MKENLSGSFVVINTYLIDDLKAIGLWTPEILNQIKLNNGIKNLNLLEVSSTTFPQELTLILFPNLKQLHILLLELSANLQKLNQYYLFEKI